jgi:PIN domain nuclease of toxin-antitoxin system
MIDDNGFEVLPLSTEHAIELSSLEFIHRDPFDRMIIAQAIIENLTIVTKDEQIQKYVVKTAW